jgi:3-oxoacyl-[acyl-carrier-protein] synthase II
MDTQREPIVITGVGLATSLGLTPEQTWRGILDGRSGFGVMPALEVAPPGEKGGYQAMDLPADFAADLPREARYLRWTIAQALADAGAGAVLPYQPSRCGFVLGTTLHGMRSAGRFLRSGNAGELRHFMAGSTLQQAIAGLPLTGEAVTTCSACSSSLGSIALAVTLLETHRLDLVVAGGYDTVSEYAYGGFNSLRLVADGLLRPFAKDRQGMKLGEGYGILILERADDARRRNAKLLATIWGCGESADAHHLTQPHPQGRGAAAAIRGALRRAGMQPGDVDLIAAHATGTPDNDAGEHAALAAVFGEQLPQTPVVAFKSHLGHTLGGAGAVELILSALALRDQIVPTCASVSDEDIEYADLSVSTGKPRRASIRATLNTSLGFGGANTCAILVPPSDVGATLASPGVVRVEEGDAGVAPTAKTSSREVFITGIGIIVPGAAGLEAFARRLAQETPPAWKGDSGPIPEAEYVHLLNARRVRRMSEYVKLTLAATALACQDAEVADPSMLGSECPVLLGTTHGSATYCIDYYRQIVQGGLIAANPMLFAEGVPNAAAAHLSLMLSLKGACQTVIGSRTAGLDALRLASIRIAAGQWDRAIVGAAEEYVPLVNEAYRHAGLYAGERASPPFKDGHGFSVGSGAVTFLLESREAMQHRGGRARGQIIGSSTACLTGRRSVDAIRTVLADLHHPRHVMSSANGTWIDRAESAALRRSDAILSTLYGHFPELFSAGPLAAIAAGLSAGDEPPNSFGVLCTGYTGTVAGVRIERR